MIPNRQHKLQLIITPVIRELLPEKIRNGKGSQFTEGVSETIRDMMNHLDGVIQSMSVGERSVKITWQQLSDHYDPLQPIVELLQKGRYPDAIILLELLLSEASTDTDYLYNLGMAYSDIGKLESSISLLEKLTKQQPGHTNGRVALGVAYLRNGQDEKGVRELQLAVADDPKNPWAQRNLGAGLARLGRYDEAVECLRQATVLNPDDTSAWYGLGQALEGAGDDEAADEAYRRVLEIDEFGQIAELTRQARSKIAQKTFRSVTPSMERMDAVMYCLGALEKFETISVEDVQKIGFEIAILGTRGIDVNDPEPKYTLRSLPGQFSGLHLLSLEYVAFKKFAPEQNIGFDLAAEYQSALSLYERKKGKKGE